MTEAYYHLMRTSHVLRHRSDDPESLARSLGVASSGEKIMIKAALSLIPSAWLKEVGIDVEPLRLCELGSLDEQSTRSLLEAISIATGHPVALLPR